MWQRVSTHRSKVISDDRCWKDRNRQQDRTLVGRDWRAQGGLPEEVTCAPSPLYLNSSVSGRVIGDGLREVGRGQGTAGVAG